MKRAITRLAIWPIAAIAALLVVGSASASSPSIVTKIFNGFTWNEVYDGSKQSGMPGWTGRAGLQAVELRNRLYVMGGRTPDPKPPFNPFGSTLWNDVWESRDLGLTWTQLAPEGPNMWDARGYFQAVTKGRAMFVLGGQDFSVAPNVGCTAPPAPFCPPFVPNSTFFNDVWRSTDGTTWERLTDNAWTAKDGTPLGRAGLSAIEFKDWIYVLGGGKGDDIAIGGSKPRQLFNDVWRSSDGKTWEQVTAQAQWKPRAGAALVEKNGYMYLLGGEDGFACTGSPGPLKCPYFNDVWRSRDGANWELVTEHAGWSARPGHQCQVVFDTIVCFGGFGFSPPPPGFPPPPAPPAHPVDMWVSRDGERWEELRTEPWNATGPAEGKYDFDSLVVRGGFLGLAPSIYTFGGDREASFTDANAALVDDEVWRFSPPWLTKKP